MVYVPLKKVKQTRMFKPSWFCGVSWLAGLDGFGALFRVGNQLD